MNNHGFESHSAIADLLGAFALDALDDDEMRRVREHLLICELCRSEVEEHHQVAALLAQAGGDAPAHLWDRIADSAHHTIDAITPISDGDTDLHAGRSSAFGAPRTTKGTVIHIRAPRTVLSLAAAILAIAIVSLALSPSLSTSRSTSISAMAHDALSSSGAQRVALSEVGNARQRLAAEVAVLPSGTAYVVNDRLPSLPPTRTYQLWGATHKRFISLGLLGNRPSASTFHVDPSAHVMTFAITNEPAGGVVSPTAAPVAEGQSA